MKTVWIKYAVLLAVAAAAGAAFAASTQPSERVVRITASKFRYDPPKVTLKRGEPVVIELTTSDRSHGFKLPELEIDVKIEPGETGMVRVKPEMAGTFSFVCDVFCGSGHEEMEGEIVVTE